MKSDIVPNNELSGLIFANKELAFQNEVFKKEEEKITKVNHLYAFISQVNQNIVRVKDEETLFRNSCHIAIEFGKFKMAWIGIFEADNKINLVEQCGIPAKNISLFTDVTYENQNPQNFVLRTGTYYICNDVEQDPNIECLKPFARRNGIRSFMVLPIRKSGVVIGTFNLFATELYFSFKEEIELMVEVASDISFALDIFENARHHQATEALLLTNEKRFRVLIERGLDMISLKTVDGELLYVSPSITTVLGYGTNELLSHHSGHFIHPDDAVEMARQTAIILQTPGSSFFHQPRYRHKNGNWIWCEGYVTNMLHEPGIHALVSNFRDVSERKLAEERLVHKNEQLMKANAELDRFVYSASHDLRSPLTSVLGLLHFIETESKEADTLQYAEMIHTCVTRLDGFILNILNYSRNNRTELEVEEIPLQKTIEEIVDALRYMQDAKQLHFEISINERETFFSDKQRFSIALENIISNAIKYQRTDIEEHYIKITGHSDKTELRLRVEDNGIGIAEEYHEKIFDMFFRLSSKVAGTGVGLYIVREIMEKLDGSIKVESEKGKGTAFIIALKNFNHATNNNSKKQQEEKHVC